MPSEKFPHGKFAYMPSPGRQIELTRLGRRGSFSADSSDEAGFYSPRNIEDRATFSEDERHEMIQNRNSLKFAVWMLIMLLMFLRSFTPPQPTNDSRALQFKGDPNWRQVLKSSQATRAILVSAEIGRRLRRSGELAIRRSKQMLLPTGESLISGDFADLTFWGGGFTKISHNPVSQTLVIPLPDHPPLNIALPRGSVYLDATSLKTGSNKSIAVLFQTSGESLILNAEDGESSSSSTSVKCLQVFDDTGQCIRSENLSLSVDRVIFDPLTESIMVLAVSVSGCYFIVLKDDGGGLIRESNIFLPIEPGRDAWLLHQKDGTDGFVILTGLGTDRRNGFAAVSLVSRQYLGVSLQKGDILHLADDGKGYRKQKAPKIEVSYPRKSSACNCR